MKRVLLNHGATARVEDNCSPETIKMLNELLEIAIMKTEQIYTEADLVKFGEYLLSEVREKNLIHETNKREVTHADLENWKPKEMKQCMSCEATVPYSSGLFFCFDCSGHTKHAEK